MLYTHQTIVLPLQLSNHTGYPLIKGHVFDGSHLQQLLEGLTSNNLICHTHLLTGTLNQGGEGGERGQQSSVTCTHLSTTACFCCLCLPWLQLLERRVCVQSLPNTHTC
jgi:hypothetical protein